jgi:hypothetical protein
MEKLDTLLEYSVSYIINQLEYFKGNTYDDPYELANDLTMSDNMSGSFTYSTYKAQEYIKEWFWECGEYIEEYESQYGEKLDLNPFTNSEKFHARVVMFKIDYLLSHLQSLSIKDKITLDDETIKAITDELNKVKE